jgi:serine protease Do
MEPDGMPGVLVADVGKDTPAASAGIKQGDFVISVGERAIARAMDVAAALADVAPSASVQVIVRRGQQQLTLQVAPRAKP